MLRESQKRLDDGQKLLNERENRANEVDWMLKRKQTEIEEAEKEIETSKKSLKLVKDDISARLSSLTCKEKVLFIILVYYLLELLSSNLRVSSMYFLHVLTAGSRNQV